MEDTYLGDSVYARFDGYQVWVYTQEYDRGIALEPDVLLELVKYNMRCRTEVLNAIPKPST